MKTKKPNPITLRFESRLHTPTEHVWKWITSVKGIRAEMRPFLRMTVPKGVQNLTEMQVAPGTRLFRSYILLFGLIPMDYSDLTLLELRNGQGFLEQSPMGSMTLWRHERTIAPCPTDPGAVLLIDQLTFQPRMAKRLVGWFVHRFFMHRHKVLRANLRGALSDSEFSNPASG